MPIHPLPQFEADVKAMLDEQDRVAYEALKAPKTLVVRFGAMKLVGEFAYSLSVTPGCGSKVVVRTHRGIELGEMLTSTCPNSGCGKSVSRKEMLGYIQNSGGRDYPFFQEGRVLRIATVQDLDRQSELEQSRHGLKMEARIVAERIHTLVRVVDAEAILGNEVLTFFYLSEERIDVRDLHHALSDHFRCRVDLKQVGARDDARLTADYERCGQYCCCKNFLKVLKPVSMKSAKVQKATLDPLKISGRCGRLMCCLRYEDETYEELRKKLPRKKSRVGTPEGDGVVIDSQILTQLVLVALDDIGADGKERHVAIAVEDLTPPVSATAPVRSELQTKPPDARGPESRGSEGRGQERRAESRPPQNRPAGDAPSARLPRPERPATSRPARPEGARTEVPPPDVAQPPSSPGGPSASDGNQSADAANAQPRPFRPARGPRGVSARPPQGPHPTGPKSGPNPGKTKGPSQAKIANQPPPNEGPSSSVESHSGNSAGSGPQQVRQGNRPPRSDAPRSGGKPSSAEDSIDDIWNDMETDAGDGQSRGKGQGQGGGSGGSRRRRRRRGGRGGGSGPGGNEGGGNGGGPPSS
jgi:cell fate regulator YaaT (PSP1 superfamily)